MRSAKQSVCAERQTMAVQFEMPLISSLAQLPLYGITRAALAVGVFDGVHLGHCKLIKELERLAGELDAYPVAVTFSPHPRQLLFPDSPPQLLLGAQEKARLLFRAGARALVTLPFTEELARLSPEEFLEKYIFLPSLEIAAICVGKKWRFGAGGKGDCLFLENEAKKRNFLFSPVEEKLFAGEKEFVISSSSIREAVKKGDLSLARALLGRPYSLSGKVVKGYKIAGTVLGTPTANLQWEEGVLPPDGVYAAGTEVDGKYFMGAVNLGFAPTFDYEKKERRLELHLLDFPAGKTLYDRHLTLDLWEFLREEKEFASPEELKKAIANDIKRIREIFQEEEK